MSNELQSYVVRALIDLGSASSRPCVQMLSFRTATDGAGAKLNGDHCYCLTLRADLPAGDMSRYVWSVVALAAARLRRQSRFAFRKVSGLKPEADGSVTLHLSGTPPRDVPEENWLPTPKGSDYELTLRLHGPGADRAWGSSFPPLIRTA